MKKIKLYKYAINLSLCTIFAFMISSCSLINLWQPKAEPSKEHPQTNPEDLFFNSFPDYEYIADPDNITKDTQKDNKIYVYLKFTGESEKGYFTANKNGTQCYPRQVHFEIGTKKINFYGYYPAPFEKHIDQMENYQSIDLDRLNYNYFTGFADYSGKEMYIGVYINDSSMAVNKGNKDQNLVIDNLVILDSQVTGEFMGLIEFFRRNSSQKITISVPVSQFNETVHENKAYFTINCLPDKSNAENNYQNIEITFDGFAKK